MKGTVILLLRIDNCDERQVYRKSDISVFRGGKLIMFTSPESPDFSVFNGVRQ